MKHQNLNYYIRLLSAFIIIFPLTLITRETHADTHQAEDYTQARGCRVAANHANHGGSGFVDMGGKNSWFESDVIDGGQGGAHSLTIRYASHDNQNRRCTIFINGNFAGELDFAPTGRWNVWGTDTIEVELASGMNTIQVQASTTEGGPNVDSIVVTPLDTGDGDNDEPEAFGPEAFGNLNFAIVLLDYADDGSAQSVEDIREGYLTGEHSVANFIDQASYGRTTMSGDVFGWIVPSAPLYGNGSQWSNCWPSDQERFNILLENYPEADLDEYDGFIFYVHRHPDSDCHALGVSTTIGIETRETYTSFGTIDSRINYVATDFYFPFQAYSRITDSTAAHEIIHSLGIRGHSLSYVCENQTLSTNAADCYIQAYGDIFSIMGLRSQSSHPNLVVSERLGWLNDENIVEVNESDTYQINSLEEQTLNLKGIKIPLENPIDIGNGRQIDHLYVEYRGMTGFDKRGSWFRNITLDDGSQTTIDNIHGALIHGADCTTNDYCVPYLLDMHPGSVDASYPPNRVARAYLYEGETFEVPQNNIVLTVLEVQEENFIDIDVQITPPVLALMECPTDVILQAIPTPDAPSHINWTLGSTRLALDHQSSALGCNACVFSTDRLVYSISSEQSFTCPSEIYVAAKASDGGSLDEWDVNRTGPIALSWSGVYAGVQYCSYRDSDFSHELMQCQ